MTNVNEELRREQREKLAAMTPAERIALADALGEAAIEAFMSAHAVDRAAALKAMRRSRRAGRRPSKSADAED